MIRVLVTSSRLWTDPVPVIGALNLCWHAAQIDQGGVPLRVMDGDCPTGGDHWSKIWCSMRLPGTLRLPRPAKWTEHDSSCRPGRKLCEGFGPKCRNAGFRRNGEMAEELAGMGPGLCLAFIRDGSGGASDCRTKAKAAGLEVVTFDWHDWRSGLEGLRYSALGRVGVPWAGRGAAQT